MRPSIMAFVVLTVAVSAVSAQDAPADRVPSTSKMADKSAHVPGQQQPRMASPIDQPKHGWWSGRAAAWIGAIGGTTIGLLGALMGTLGGCGIARRFVLTLMAVLIGVGAVSLVVGLVALALDQPYAVYYPLLLGGIILAAVFGGNLIPLRRRYEQIELRKMAAMDAGLVNSRPTEKP